MLGISSSARRPIPRCSALNGKPAAGLAIFQNPDANALAVATAVRARMQELAKSFPPDLVYTIPFDTTGFRHELDPRGL